MPLNFVSSYVFKRVSICISSLHLHPLLYVVTWGSSAEWRCIIHDLMYGAAFHMESVGPLSLMNIMAKSFVLSLLIIMFITLNL
jgi:hypothetical protein